MLLLLLLSRSVVSDSVRPHRWQPIRLPCPWDSPGKNTGVGCHFLVQCMKVKSLSRVWLLATPWTTAYQAPLSRQEYWSGVPLASPPGLPVHHQLLEFTQTHVHWVGDAIQPYHSLSSPSPLTFNLSQHQGLFQRVSSSHQVPKYGSFSFNISLPNEHSGLISFRTDWLDLLEVQGTFKNLSNTSVQKQQFFGTQLSLWFNSFFYFKSLWSNTNAYSKVNLYAHLSFRWFSHIEMTGALLWSSSFSKYWDRTKLSLVSFSAAYPLPLSWFLTLITLHWGIHTIAGPFLCSLGC